MSYVVDGTVYQDFVDCCSAERDRVPKWIHSV